MPTLKKIVPLIGVSLILSGCSLPFLTPKKAALKADSIPRATVFLDGEHIGQTPFLDDKLKAGEYTLRLVPEDQTGRLPAWETKVKLSPQIVTVVDREIATTDAESSGAILTLEPLSTKSKSALAIISLPDGAVVKIDNQPKGFAPINLDDVTPGEHLVSLTQTGYKEKTLRVKITSGHKLTISAQLAKAALLATPTPEPQSNNEKSKPTPNPSPTDDQIVSASATAKSKPYVEILPNSVGFLRIRENPSSSAKELARAVPGQHLPYLDEENNGWYKVTYALGKTGWLARGASGEYAKLMK